MLNLTDSKVDFYSRLRRGTFDVSSYTSHETTMPGGGLSNHRMHVETIWPIYRYKKVPELFRYKTLESLRRTLRKTILFLLTLDNLNVLPIVFLQHFPLKSSRHGSLRDDNFNTIAILQGFHPTESPSDMLIFRYAAIQSKRFESGLVQNGMSSDLDLTKLKLIVTQWLDKVLILNFSPNRLHPMQGLRWQKLRYSLWTNNLWRVQGKWSQIDLTWPNLTQTDLLQSFKKKLGILSPITNQQNQLCLYKRG